ncbi:MAG: hypothetical protein H0W61_16100 [Bacteroidetes bacterium]|nr:hypothetical protein [Bacteroidota bacterium]
MKKLFTIIFLAILMQANSQSFYKGALVIDAGAGLEIFNTKVSITEKSTGKTETSVDKAGNSHFILGGEYGILKNLGVGIRYKNNSYFTEKDSVTGTKGTIKSNDILLLVNYHLISKKSFDFIVGADFGYSGINYHFNDSQNTQLKGSGLYYSFYMNPRLYIGRFGFNMKLGLPFVNYPKLKTNDSDFNKSYSAFNLKATPGFGLSFGIQFRFLDVKE